jgi:hypothetical protein
MMTNLDQVSKQRRGGQMRFVALGLLVAAYIVVSAAGRVGAEAQAATVAFAKAGILPEIGR